MALSVPPLEYRSGPPPRGLSPAPRADARLAALVTRATRRRCDGALLSALSSGLLSGDPQNTEALFALGIALAGDALARRQALTRLLGLANDGEPGAMVLLGWLDDEYSREDLAALIAEPHAEPGARVAAVRGALFILRAAGRAASLREPGMLAALKAAANDGRPAVRYTAAFVCASLGQREVRGTLERGALEERDPELLRLCLLGIDRVGDAASLPFVWRVWMRHPDLRDLTDTIAERLERDLRGRERGTPAEEEPPLVLIATEAIEDVAEVEELDAAEELDDIEELDALEELTAAPAEPPPLPTEGA